MSKRTQRPPGGNPAVTLAEPGWTPSPPTTVVPNPDDCHAARGVRCADPVVFPGCVTFRSFYDPFGNRLQMCSPAPAE